MNIQLVYMSAATRPLETFELSALLATSRRRNESLGISGMLLYHAGSFLQVLEGEEQRVERLYERICLDDRHTNCELLLKCFIDRKDFADWTMGFVNGEVVDLRQFPGYADFLSARAARQRFTATPSTPRKLLQGFREGKWRQLVDAGQAQDLATASH